MQAAESGNGFQEIGGFGAVVLAEPLDLAFVAEEHLLFGLGVVGDIDVVGGLKVNAGEGVSVEDGDYGLVGGMFGFVEGGLLRRRRRQKRSAW